MLIIDEVLAVGDFEFQRKCLGKMQDVAGHGRTVLFVSHNMAAVQGLCTSAMILRHGQKTLEGPVRDCVAAYMSSDSSSSSRQRAGVFDIVDRVHANGCSTPIMQRMTLMSDSGEPTDRFLTGGPLRVRIDVVGFDSLPNAQIGVIVKSQADAWLAAFNTGMRPPRVQSRSAHESVTLTVPQLPFVPGEYKIDLSIGTEGDRALRVRRACGGLVR